MNSVEDMAMVTILTSSDNRYPKTASDEPNTDQVSKYYFTI
jgi:hypothetical protein